ncbi:gliding motility-associated C-terminal domain-containing protein [Marinifilum caeruleilacunae]|uniref:T9SS type B sorting domain-containing protein n=1 Tax=Marinifilum caeruleilacunae TaxID=2499076 RepID=A0ABX1WYZ9_9BACT|nr:gliding motility-associated C-terminal domain-containing protein [Marinifilum caeruleilacunae]NOU61334.1 T9SS type B sorting domain-containing protein [Marinifilum caeruleilacunae]
MKRYGIRLLLLILLHTVYITAEARDFYWIGGSGNFNDIQHWSDQPGGKVNPEALLPDKDDNVYFDEFSFPDPGAEVVITNVARCANMHWGNVKNMPTLKTDANPAHYLVIYGGVTFTNQMIIDLDRPLYFRASTQGNTIDFGGNIFDGDLIFENNGGWRITGDLDILDNDIQFQQGTLSIEAEVNCGSIVSETSISRELFLNSATINLNKTGNSVLSFQTDNLTVHPGNSTINILSDNSSVETTGMQMVDFYDLVFSGNAGEIVNSSLRANFNKLTFQKDGSLSGENDFQELVFTEGNSYTLNNGVQNVQVLFTALGQCYSYISITGGGAGGFISANGVALDYLKVRNITANGGAAPFAANNSYDLGANTGWNFIAPSADDYTWTGAGGDNLWGNHLNWDKSCVPSRNNNATIPDGFTVEINVPAECKELTVLGTSVIGGNNSLEVYSSLNATGANWAFNGETYLKGSGSVSLNATMSGALIVEATGAYTLATNISIDNVLRLISGNLSAATFDIDADRFESNSSQARTLDITNSTIDINEGVMRAWHVEGSGFTFNGTGSQITLTQSGAEFYNNNSDGINYGAVLFNPLDNQVFLTNDNATDYPTFDELRFNGSAIIKGNHQYHKLVFAEGNEYLFQAGSTQKILDIDGLTAMGSCSENISLKGDGGIAFIDSDVNSSNIQRIRVEDVNVVGGMAGVLQAKESVGVSGYDGWVFPNDLVGGDVNWTGAVDGNWFEAGNWDTGCVPTRKDNVFFDEGSIPTGNLNVNISVKGKIAECNNMTWIASPTMTFSGDQQLNVFGSLDMSGMAVGNNSFSGEMNFKAETAQTITIGAVELISDLNFVGNKQDDGTWKNGPWALNSDLTTTGIINLERGDLSTNNHQVEANEFYSNYGVDNLRSLNLGSSILKVDRLEVSANSFTLLAGTSEIQMATAGEFIVSTGDEVLNFHNLTFQETTGNAYLDVFADDVSFNNMVFNGNTYFRKPTPSKISFTAENIQMAVGKTYVFESGQTFILGGLNADGACEGTIDISGSDSDAAIFQAKSGVTDIEVNSVNLLNVHAEPDNVFVAKASLDLGNTTGWKFEDEPTGRDLFWVGGEGNWDDPNHWSTTSGGAADGCVPTAKDNVFFDVNSFNGFDQNVYTGAGDIRCRTMDWTGSETARPNFVMGATDISGVYIYGSFILNAELDIDLSPLVNFYFRATEAQSMNTFGYVFPNVVEFDGKSGVWTMYSDFQTSGDLFIRQGKLVANGNLVECKSITSIDQPAGIHSRGLDISNSNVIVNGSEDVSGRSIYINLADESYDQGFELVADNSTVRVKDIADVILVGTAAHSISFNDFIFEQGGKLDGGFSGLDVYASHMLIQGDGVINGKKNSFGTLELARGFEYKLEKGRTITTDNLLVEGSCFAPIYLHSTKDGAGNETFIKANNNVTGNFLELKDIHADVSEGVTYTATNSFDLGNVTGWTIDGAIAPIALYWTGNGADDDWNNHENWSRAMDGSEEGCVPTLNDDVFFTSNSFFGSKLVEITADAKCHSMTWNDDIDPDANFSVTAKLQIGGSMDLTESMALDMQGTFEFVGDGLTDNKTVDFASKTMDGDIRFIGTSQNWTWQTGFVTSGNLIIDEGSVSTQENNFTVNQFSSLSLHDFDAVRSFDMTKSLVTISSDAITGWNMKMNTTGGLTFTSTDSYITFENGGGIYCETDGDVHFGFVDFVDNGVINIKSTADTEQGYFGSVRFMEEGKIFGNNEFTNLEFTLGYENNTIESGKTITVHYDLKMEGVRCSYVFLKSSTAGVPATVHKPSGTFDKIYNAALTDIQGTSGSGQPHPVKYHFEEDNTTGFVLYVDPSGEENPPSFEESFDKPREEWCSNVAVLDHVEGFPINSSTTFQWYFSADDGATDPYTELTGETNPVIEVDQNGFYKVEVRYGINKFDGTDCKIESKIEVALGEVSKVSLEITSNNVKCFGQGNGRIIAKVADVQYPEYQFFWEDESGTEITTASTDKTIWESTAFNLDPGKYHVTVADGKNCTFDTIVNVFDAYELLIDNIDTKDLACFTVPEGEILIDASGGTGGLSYYLDDNLQASENITGLFSGDYKVYVQDENDCKTVEEDVTINSNPEMIVDLNGLDLKCYGDANGEFSPSVIGGVPDYSYSWTGPDGYTSSDNNISGLAGGLYQLTVTDNAGCVASKEQELNEPSELIAEELVVEPANCHGDNTGEIFVVGGQGTPDYRYFLDGVEETTGIFKGLAPENYVLRIVDGHGCILEQEITVTEPNKIGFIVADKVLPSCENTEDGIIYVTPYGGNEGYSYTWTGPNDYKAYQKNIENLVSGKYSLEVTDKKNCSYNDTVDLDIGLPLQLGVVVEQHVETPGANEGILALELFEGRMPYTFTVSGPSGTFSSPDNFDENNYLIENLAAGVYHVIATDASGCTTVEKSVIIESPGLVYTYINQVQPVGCVGFSDGELEAVAAGGSGTYTYSWTGPSGYTGSGQSISGLAPGTYSVTVTDGGNTANASYELLAADPIVVSVANYKDVSCNQAGNGEIELSVDAGKADYTIEWTNDLGTGFLSSAKRILNLEPALYTYTVTTATGCSVSGNQLIAESTDMNLTVTPTDITAEGQRDGTISASFGGGTAPYTVLISGPNGYSYADVDNTTGSVSVSGLEMGIYEVAVIDANSCRIEDDKKVHEPSKLLLYTTLVTHNICPGASDGAISLGIEGASDPANLTFTWSGANYFRSNDQDITGLSSGTYKVTVHDSGGDPGYEEQTLIVIVEEPDLLDVEVFTKNITCPGMDDGYINIQPKGGTPAYTCVWTGTGVIPTNEDQENLSAGIYTVEITDRNGCKSTPVDIEIVEPAELYVAVADSKEPTCYGLENGWIQLDITEGTAPYVINWDNYGSVTQRIEELTRGTYDYIVTDDNGCSKSGTFTLNEPDTLIAEVNDFEDVLCHGDGTGRAYVDITGGTPDYTILWSDGQDTQEATDLKLGTYEVSVTDAQGCNDVSIVDIFEPEPLALEVEVIRPTTYDAMDGALGVSVSGGVTDYTYNWSTDGIALDNSPTLEDLDRGTYHLNLVDANGCELDSTIVVEYLFERRIRIPKAFTPNADGYNDYWDIDRIEFIQNLKIVIYDRWGKAVYKFSGTGNEYKGEPWKGYNGNMKLPIGSYYYAVEVDEEKPIMGTVTILR